MVGTANWRAVFVQPKVHQGTRSARVAAEEEYMEEDAVSTGKQENGRADDLVGKRTIPICCPATAIEETTTRCNYS